MKNHRFTLGFLFTTLLGLTGCEPVPEIHSFTKQHATELVTTRTERDQFRWPVLSDKWQVTKPTDFAFLRAMPAGAMKEFVDKIAVDRRQRIEAAAQSETPAPWTVAAHDFSGEAAAELRLALDEYDGHPIKKFSVSIPNQIQNPKAQLDLTARHLVLSGENGIWIARLPWRPWWALPGTDPTDQDEPGDLEDLQQIELTGSNSGAAMVGFFGQDENGGDSRCFVAKGEHLYVVDCSKRSVIATSKFETAIQHLSVASETGNAILVDTSGGLFVTDAKLDHVSRIGEINTTLPMPAISPEAARIATYKTKNMGHVFKLDNGVVVDSFDVVLENPGEPLMIRCSRAYDMWIEKNAINRRPNYPNNPGSDRKGWRMTMYWDLEQVLDVHNFPTECSQLCVATRPQPDGEKQRVLFDAQLGGRSFSRPVAMSTFGDQSLTCAASGDVIAFYDDKTVDVYARGMNAPQGLHGIQGIGRNWSWQNRFDELEKLHKLIRSLPENRFHRTPEQFYSELAGGIGRQWANNQQLLTNEKASESDLKFVKERNPAYEEWAKKKSTLAMCSEIKYRTSVAWSARGTGWSNSVNASSWKIFENENNRAMEVCKELLQLDDVPACVFDYYIGLARDTSLEYDDTADTVKRFMHLYPEDVSMHMGMMNWRLEKWGGTRGSGPAYAGGVAKAIGPPMGDFVYSRCIESIQGNFQHAFFNYAHVDGSRVLDGVEQGLRMGYYQEESTLTTMYLLAQSHSRSDSPDSATAYAAHARRLCEELADRYRQCYPMAISRSADSNQFQPIKQWLPD
ncbi:hypothetical protein SH528x_002847 [Novipirellula sp. SH528]|uniref:hypothetical protein n=1 Tax=Novipirellula sp. SH528 TaxID=3454466 RepID=UPI003FA0000C